MGAHDPRGGRARGARPARLTRTPRTNGKAERFIKTLQERWAYARLDRSSAERAAALPTSTQTSKPGCATTTSSGPPRLSHLGSSSRPSSSTGGASPEWASTRGPPTNGLFRRPCGSASVRDGLRTAQRTSGPTKRHTRRKAGPQSLGTQCWVGRTAERTARAWTSSPIRLRLQSSAETRLRRSRRSRRQSVSL